MKTKKALLVVLVVLMTLSIPLASLSAATKEYYITRGIQNLCYSKDTVTFTYASSKISSSNARQARSGILVNLRGIPRYSTTTTQHVYDAKKELLVGANIGGFTLGWARTVTDRITVTGAGACSVRWDI